jgi:hypothetical protein
MTVEEAQGVVDWFVDKYNLKRVPSVRIAAVTPEVIEADPEMQSLVGKPISLGNLRLVVVPKETEKIHDLFAQTDNSLALLPPGTVVESYGPPEDEALDVFEWTARSKPIGFAVLRRQLVSSPQFIAILRTILANLPGAEIVNVPDNDLLSLARALAALA